MNYSKIYNALIEKSKLRGLDKSKLDGYFESHHIIPRCLGGSDEDENLVLLTAREHFIAHMLLWKIYPNEDGIKYAAMMMSNRFGTKRTYAKTYENLRKDFIAAVSKNKKGSYKDLTGKIFGRLTVVEFDGMYKPPSGTSAAKWLCQCSCGKYTSVVSSSLTTKNTRSCGCLLIENSKSLIGDKNPFYGRKHSKETLEKIAKTKEDLGLQWPKEYHPDKTKIKKARTSVNHPMYGKKHSEKSLLKMSLSQKQLNVRPWNQAQALKPEWQIKWSNCDLYYDFWIRNGKPGLKKLTRLYNEEFNTNLDLSFFTNPRLHFLKGWIPKEDPEWVEFSSRVRGNNIE